MASCHKAFQEQTHRRLRSALAAALCVLCSPAPCMAQWDWFGTMDNTRELSEFEALPGFGLDCFEQSSFPAGQALTLSMVIDRALCANPRIRQAWGVAKFRAAQAGGARAADMPSLSFGGQWMRGTVTTEVDDLASLESRRSREQRNMSLALSWVLYDAGLRAGNIAQADATLNAALQGQRTTILLVLQGCGKGLLRVARGPRRTDCRPRVRGRGGPGGRVRPRAPSGRQCDLG